MAFLFVSLLPLKVSSFGINWFKREQTLPITTSWEMVPNNWFLAQGHGFYSAGQQG
jgi:hypothetical protein